MQETLKARSWAERSRLRGALRFHRIKLGMAVLWVLGILLAAQVAMMLLAVFGVTDYENAGVSVDFGTAMALLLALSCLVAKSHTTFLLRFGTPRTSVWVSNLVSLFVCGALFLLGSLAINTLCAYLALAFGQSNAAFRVAQYYGELDGAALVVKTLTRSLAELPWMLLWTLEWTCVFYLLGCCLRRNKVITLTVCIAGPLVLWLLLLLPAVRQVLEVVESGDQTQWVLTGVQWMGWLAKAGEFVRTNWQWVQGGMALASLPLSYVCMRGTPQP